VNILALGAHPDDLEIYMFGTLSAFAERGDRLTLAIATDGAKGGREDGVGLSQQRKGEARAAAALLDTEPRFLDFPDGALLADASLVGVLGDLIAEVLPDLIVTHAPNDYHRDHRALSQAVALASSFSAPVLYADTLGGVAFTPTHYIDITSRFEQKTEAILCHRSQDPQRFVLGAQRLNNFRAGQANNPEGYAEAFRFEPIYPFVDIRDLLPPAPPVRPVRNRNRPEPNLPNGGPAASEV